MLVDPPNDLIGEEESEEDRRILERNSNMMFDFIVDCVLKTYGWRYVGKWIEKSPGRSVLDIITVSDIAYAITVIENSKDVWEQQEEIKSMSPTQQAKFKNPKALPASQRKRYTRKVPKYTTRKGRVAGYMATGWTKDGKKRYMEIKNRWEELYKDALWNEQWYRCWEYYAEKFDVVSYWVKNKPVGDQGTTSNDKDEEEVCDDNLFCSRGTGDRIAVGMDGELGVDLSDDENGEQNNTGEVGGDGEEVSSSDEDGDNEDIDDDVSRRLFRGGEDYGRPKRTAGV